jgi:hypothetical protein
MQYKIQQATPYGFWADVKESEDGGPLRPALFASKTQARAEIDEICEALNESQQDYRIVTANTLEKGNIYE